VRIFLRRDGISLGRDRTARIWAKHGLQVPAKKTKKRYRPERTQIGAPSRPNEVWSYDFVFDACANGQKLKCLTMIDEFTKESLFIDVAGSIRGKRVVEVLELVAAERGYPQYLRSDNELNAIGVAQKEKAHSWLSTQPKKQRYCSALPNSHFHALRRASIYHNEHKIQQ
jgi:putative transposase